MQQKRTSMLYRRAGMQDAGSRATARGARGARAGAPPASPYEKPPSKILERTACSARSAIPHAVLALAQAEPCMQRACQYRTTSREPRLPPVTPLCPLTPAAAVTRTRVTMHATCIPLRHALAFTWATHSPVPHPSPHARSHSPTSHASDLYMHATCMPFPHALTRATLPHPRRRSPSRTHA